MNTTTTDTIMRAILEEPHDNLHRLAYADLLEEQGQDDHAEFIRVQLEIGDRHHHYKLTEDVVEACADREFTLAWELCQRGVFDAPTQVRRIWSRGFVCGICLPLSQFMDHAEDMFRKQPIAEVYLTDREPFHEQPGDNYSWWDAMDANDLNNEDQSLPSELFACFDVDEWDVTFPSLAEANEALSRACVRYGRKKVGLPELKG